MNFLKTIYDTEGPLGLPMKDKQARLLDGILRTLPAEDRQLCRIVTAKKPSELLDGERADVSWISTEEIDRDREIVVARGMNDEQFKMNPIVTLRHCYSQAPVGRSLWRKRVKDGALAGIKAKTQYPARPVNWEGSWQPDTVFTLIQSGLMQGKSIGFLRLKSHCPSSHEIAALPELADVSRIIDEWLLLEYACVFLPANQSALVEAVSKGLSLPAEMADLFGIKAQAVPMPELPPAGSRIPIPFTSEVEITRLIRTRLAGINPQAIVQDAMDRAKGRI
jgi:hypothetical protein